MNDFLFGRRCGKTRLQELVRRGYMAVTQEMVDTWRRKIKSVIEAKDKGLIILNEWELNFIFSIEYRLRNTGSITIQQSITLNNIYGRIK